MSKINRQLRRHPVHPLFPILYPSKHRIREPKRKKPRTKSKGNLPVKYHMKQRDDNWPSAAPL